jgi:DNA polymerase/3'-5' exonuclease PolX
MLYEDAQDIVTLIKNNIHGLRITGQMHRKKDIITCIDFITMNNLQLVLSMMGRLFDNSLYLNRNGNNFISMMLNGIDSSIFINIRMADDPYEFKYLKWMQNITKKHAMDLFSKASKKNLKLSSRGLYNSNEERLDFEKFSDLKNYLFSKDIDDK